ncbi:hypothetical protein TNCV_681611 [Trichonephila clavipes]|nr:hypothetical protein TNCV_681611 [Trichonephila clavipes]
MDDCCTKTTDLLTRPYLLKQFLTYKSVTVMDYPTYSLELAPCDLCLFPTVKSFIKGSHCFSIKSVLAKTENILKGLPKRTVPAMTALNVEVFECGRELLRRRQYHVELILYVQDLLDQFRFFCRTSYIPITDTTLTIQYVYPENT